jgi:3-dehydroquinate dehydratase II
MKKIMVINGVNLNMLGIREPGIYGNGKYEDLIKYIKDKESDVDLSFYQSNHEGDIVDTIQNCYFEKFDGIVINPGAFTHYSYAILDAIKAVSIKTVEVHISDIDSREEFRKISVIKPACVAQIKGKGWDGYIEAIELLKK